MAEAGVPIFRRDLDITPRLSGQGTFTYVVRDPHSGELYVLREEDYFICRHLDGTGTIPEIQAAFQSAYDKVLPREQLEAFLRALDSMGLVESAAEEAGAPAGSPMEAALRSRRFNDPDIFFRHMATLFGWCFSWGFMLVVGVLFFTAAGILVKYGDDLLYDFLAVWETGQYLFFVVVGVLLSTLLSEVAKATACKHYGGEIHEWGIRYAFRIFPRFYSDLSDVPWIPSKGNRLRIWSAGLVLQVCIFSVGVIMWKKSIPLTDAGVFWLVLIVISLWTLFLNANPLLGRDAYNLFASWLEVPGLRGRAYQVARAWLKREPLPEPLSKREVIWFRWYAVLSLTFSVLLIAGILLVIGYVLIHLLEGFGVLIFLFIFYRFAKSFRDMRNTETA